MEDLLLLLVLCAISKAAIITYRISEYKKYKARVLAKRKSSPSDFMPTLWQYARFCYFGHRM